MKGIEGEALGNVGGADANFTNQMEFGLPRD